VQSISQSEPSCGEIIRDSRKLPFIRGGILFEGQIGQLCGGVSSSSSYSASETTMTSSVDLSDSDSTDSQDLKGTPGWGDQSYNPTISITLTYR